jgi:FkbM family methyltransferase
MLISDLPDIDHAAELLRCIAARPWRRAARLIDKPLVLYGASKLGRMAMQMLKHIGHSPLAVIDRQANRLRNDPYWTGTRILHPEEVAEEDQMQSLLAVCIATAPFEELAFELEGQGWKDIVPFYDIAEGYRDQYPLSNGWELDKFDRTDIEATIRVMARWDDDISRAHHLQFIAWHRLREDWVFDKAPIEQQNRYFIPQVIEVLGDYPSLLDIGAHEGEIARRFLMETDGKFEHIWMIEPDPANAFAIAAWKESLDVPTRSRVSLQQCAISDLTGPKTFFGGIGYASQISNLGKATIEAVKVDDLNIDPRNRCLMKLHLEGGELDAMRGAAGMLNHCRPLITVTIYHNQQGVWETPEWIMRNLDAIGGYRYLMRLHSWCGTGAVLYAIPQPSSHESSQP